MDELTEYASLRGLRNVRGNSDWLAMPPIVGKGGPVS
jgi:hypothetical protein